MPDSLIMDWTTKSGVTVGADGPLDKAATIPNMRRDNWVDEFNTLALTQSLMREADGALDAGDRDRCARTIARLQSLLADHLTRRSCLRG